MGRLCFAFLFRNSVEFYMFAVQVLNVDLISCCSIDDSGACLTLGFSLNFLLVALLKPEIF